MAVGEGRTLPLVPTVHGDTENVDACVLGRGVLNKSPVWGASFDLASAPQKP